MKLADADHDVVAENTAPKSPGARASVAQRLKAVLRGCGCHYLQGYLYGPPADASTSERLFTDALNAQMGLVSAVAEGPMPEPRSEGDPSRPVAPR